MGVKLATHFHSASRLRMHGAVPPLCHVSIWHALVEDRDDFTFHQLST